MPLNEQTRQNMLSFIDAQKSTYGSTLVQTAIVKRDGKWRNMITKIIPLYMKDTFRPLKRLDYGDFAIIESLISLDELQNIIKNLSAENSMTFALDEYEIVCSQGNLSNGYEHDSGDEYLNVGWFFRMFTFLTSEGFNTVSPLVSPKLPLFKDSTDAISHVFGFNFSNYRNYGLIFCFPLYHAKIRELTIGSTEISVTIEAGATSAENLIAKCYCQSGDKIKQEDINLSSMQGRVIIGFRPEEAYVALISASTGEMFDRRHFSSSWRLPKDVKLDMPDFEIKQLIEQGESNTLEFKRQIESRSNDVNEFVESVVAFANAKGGTIILGVDDDTTVQGLSEKDSEERIQSIIRSHCIPEPKYQFTKRTIDGKEILFMKIDEGSDKPYTVWQKGVFIRAGSSDRIAERNELDEIYGQKNSPSGHYY